MRRTTVFLTLVLLVVGLTPTAASGAPKTRYEVDTASLEFTPLEGATAMWGVHAGAGYRIEVPEDWNGELVVWTHGFRGDGTRLFLNDPTAETIGLRPYLIEQGYALAMSTYSANGYAVREGVKDTQKLTTLFRGEVGVPDRTYIAGASMGGHIAAVAIEQYPRLFDGAMPVCGAVGDYELFDFFLDFNVAAQQVALGTSTFPITDAAGWLFGTVPEIKARLTPGATDAGWPVALNDAGEDFKQLVELRSGGDRPIFDAGWSYWNSLPAFGTGPGTGVPAVEGFLFGLGIGDGTVRGEPGTALDNSDVTYQFDLDPALSADEVAFNADVVRVEADPQGRRGGLADVPQVTGDLPVPVLSMHQLGDLFVPWHNEVVYAREAAEQGKDHLLVQRAIRDVAHCRFTPAEMVEGFSDLATWVETGARPAGDDVLADSYPADLGCRWTLTPRVASEPCPAG